MGSSLPESGDLIVYVDLLVLLVARYSVGRLFTLNQKGAACLQGSVVRHVIFSWYQAFRESCAVGAYYCAFPDRG